MLLPLLPRIDCQPSRNDPGLYLISPPTFFFRALLAIASPALALALVLLGFGAAWAAPPMVSPGSASVSPGSNASAPTVGSGANTTALRQLADQRFAAGAINGAIQIWSSLIAATVILRLVYRTEPRPV